MSKVLVTYWSGSGCAAGVAERIGRTLARQGMQVDVEPIDSDPDPAGYDAVVAGSGVRAMSWHVRAKKWVTRNASAFKGKPLAFFTVGTNPTHGWGPEKYEEMRAYTAKLLADTGVEPLDIGLFVGWFVPRKFNFLERMIMRIAKTPEGDHRDWNAIEAWAESVGPKLLPGDEPASHVPAAASPAAAGPHR